MSIEQTIALLSPGSLDLNQAEEALDALTHEDRLQVIYGLNGKAQAAIFEAAKGRLMTIADVVPTTIDPMIEVIHHGKNSLPLFTHFQKRFCRTSDSPDKELWGYNHQSMAMITGPGYFVCHQHGDEVAVDYTRMPGDKPDTWPTIKSNGSGFSRFVYYDMIDYLRKVSQHVCIGRAVRGGKEQDNWFLLCRED